MTRSGRASASAVLAALLAMPAAGAAPPQEPAGGAAPPIILVGGRVFPVSGPPMEGASVLIRDGKIEAVGAIPVPPDAKRIDVSGNWVLPGLIDSRTHLGIWEVDLDEMSRDEDEKSDPVTPQARVIDAFYDESENIRVTRGTGVAAALVAPGDENLINGQSAMVDLSGGGLDQVLLKFPAAMHFSLGEPPKERFGARNQLPLHPHGKRRAHPDHLDSGEGVPVQVGRLRKKAAGLRDGKAGTGQEEGRKVPSRGPRAGLEDGGAAAGAEGGASRGVPGPADGRHPHGDPPGGGVPPAPDPEPRRGGLQGRGDPELQEDSGHRGAHHHAARPDRDLGRHLRETRRAWPGPA